MTADEMFRELGFSLAKETGSMKRYERKMTDDVITVTRKGVKLSDNDGGYCVCVDALEVLASAKLIEEMEEMKNEDHGAFEDH